MVARGDLGVEMPAEKVPSIQRLILRTARAVGKPVVVATQMLELMIEAPTPTRAEASDVATAVYEGADAVMLSAESAAGRYPVEAVRVMDRIIAEVEQDPYYREATDAAHPPPETSFSSCNIVCTARAVWSQPPPVPEGAMISSPRFLRAHSQNRLYISLSPQRRLASTFGSRDFPDMMRVPADCLLLHQRACTSFAPNLSGSVFRFFG